MQPNGLNEALERVLKEDPRFARDAYLFLRDALDYTIKQKKKKRSDMTHHVDGRELLNGIRAFALKQFGPMVVTVFNYWGIEKCEHFGHMVFNLVKAGVFGKTETDSIDDFRDVYDFREAFEAPFLPEAAPSAESRKIARDQPASELP